MTPVIVAGIDVGGPKKGFHAVTLRKRRLLATHRSCSAADVTAWCIEQHVQAVGIDAPCGWSVTRRARSCERELASLGISAFSTPCENIGEAHPFFRWMFNGMTLYERVTAHYHLYNGRLPLVFPFCFETFPHAITCALAGKTLSAKNKRMDRRRLLEQAGIESEPLRTMDEVDAALCALAAQHVVAENFYAYGDAAEGFILVPRPPSLDKNIRFDYKSQRFAVEGH